MTPFEEGYENSINNLSGFNGSNYGASYVQSVEGAIEQLNKDINYFSSHKTHINQLKGDIFEFWHSDTHNIDVVVKGVKARTFVDRSNDLGSADISSNFDTSFGLKNYKTATASAQQQAKTYNERYKEYLAKTKSDISFKEYLKSKELGNIDPNTALYSGQVRLIPKDQLEDAIKWLTRKIEKEKIIRPDNAKRYEDTLKLLTDKIKSSDGSESIPLSQADSKVIAELAKEGAFDASMFGLTTEELIKYKYVLSQSLKAGVTAATITLVLKVAPEIYKSIEQLITSGEIDSDQLKKIGFAAISGSAEGFLRGSIAAAITTACKAGLWGEALKSIDPTLIGTTTVIVMNALQNSFEVATGKMTGLEFADACARDLFITACSMTLGGITQGLIEIPILGFMLGSFVGSVAGSFVYDTGYKAFISFCIDSGFTFFGLVNQNYLLPQDVLEKIGIEVFDYEKFAPKQFVYKKFEPKQFVYKKFKIKDINICILRRGVIAVNRIGYV